MKKTLLLLIIIYIGTSASYSRSVEDTSQVEKTGWLIYYLGHVIWFESDLPVKVSDKSFFSSENNYPNGLIVDYMNEAKLLKSIATCYSIKSLTNIDTVTGKGEYSYLENICILPVQAKVKLYPTSEPLDQSSITFKRSNNEVTMTYWFLTNYIIQDIKLLRDKDKRKLKKASRADPLINKYLNKLIIVPST